MKRIRDEKDEKYNDKIDLKRLREEGILTSSFDSSIEEKEDCIKLSETQKDAMDLIMKGESVFITGEAGSGKSFLIKHITEELNQRNRAYVLTATTGVAAWNINGVTLHYFAGVGIGKGDITMLYNILKNKADKVREWERIRTLIIDEISLCDTEFFEKLEMLARRIRGTTAVFGGIQIILVGDYFQCPPIMKGKPIDAVKYLFQSSLWPKLNIKVIKLRTNFRQASDSSFQSLLERIKMSNLTEKDIETLKTRQISNINLSEMPSNNEMIKLCSTRAEAEEINLTELNRLDGESKKYEGTYDLYNDSGVIITEEMVKIMNIKEREKYERRIAQRDQPTDMTICLKIGALVMLCCNLNIQTGLYNGSRGIVKGFYPEPDKDDGPLWPFVEFENGQTLLMMPYKWEQRYYGRIDATFIQIPLLLRYAITVHKSQGLTLSKVRIKMDFFDTGLGYVAFSRVPSLKDIFLHNVDITKIKTDSAVVEFYQINKLL